MELSHCGELDGGVDGPVVWIGCECGARMARPADEADGAAGHSSQHDAEHDASAGAL